MAQEESRGLPQSVPKLLDDIAAVHRFSEHARTQVGATDGNIAHFRFAV